MRLPRMLRPTGIAQDYGRDLAQICSRVRPAFRELEVELPRLIRSVAASRGWRADANEGKRVRQLSQQARAKVAAAIRPDRVSDLADRYARTTSTFQRVQLSRVTRAALGADPFINERGLQPIMETFAHQNVVLIKGITDKVATDVESAALQAVQSGRLTGQLADDLTEKYGYAPKRAKFIARDQIGKLNGQLNATRQRAMGIEHFIWRTVHDERVRDDHEEWEEESDPAQGGTPYSYDDPPGGELPGEPINCRCYAEPFFGPVDDDDGDSSDEGDKDEPDGEDDSEDNDDS